ncbi:MAG: hypothetical protein NT020_06005 [Chloroflexales bacterium]|nr:hypothetical protein [Chloroflexales bacterium]
MLAKQLPAEHPAPNALAQIIKLGGIATFPEVLTLSDVVTRCGIPMAWLRHQIANDALPGSCFGGVLLWRCARQTFFEWVKEHADEQQYQLAGAQRSYPPHPATSRARTDYHGRTTLSH